MALAQKWKLPGYRHGEQFGNVAADVVAKQIRDGVFEDEPGSEIWDVSSNSDEEVLGRPPLPELHECSMDAKTLSPM